MSRAIRLGGSALRHWCPFNRAPQKCKANFGKRLLANSPHTRAAIDVVTSELSGMRIAARRGLMSPARHKATAPRL